MPTFPEMRKSVVALLTGVIGIGGQIVAANVVTGTALHWAQVIIAACTAALATLSVYQVSNARGPQLDAEVPDVS